MKTIIGMYDDVARLDSLLTPLMQDGVQESQVAIISDSKTLKRLKKNSQFSKLAGPVKKKSIHDQLCDRGVPNDDARFFEQGVERGNVLVIMEIDDDREPRVLEQMKKTGAVGAPARTNGKASARTNGKASAKTNGKASARTNGETKGNRGQTTKSEKIPVIEEELKVEKRVKETDGGVEVERKVETTPVREEVELKKERVEVNRRPVDRAASNEEMMGGFEEGTVQMRERKEELVVEKQPRVVEEVEVKKTTTREKGMINETLRRVDVDIHKIDQSASKDLQFNTMRSSYRKHFDKTHGSDDEKFEAREGDYRYGHAHALRDEWQQHDWKAVAPQLRDDYENRQGEGSWNRARGAVEHAWNNVRNRMNKS